MPFTRHPDPSIRTKAIVLVARSSSDAAVEAVVAGLDDSSEVVQRVALSAVAARRADGKPAASQPSGAGAAVAKILLTHDAWAIRVLAAQAMGRLGAAGAAEAGQRLVEAATRDSYALVRQAALDALATFDASAARALATRMAASDPEPRVREAAKAIAAGTHVPSE